MMTTDALDGLARSAERVTIGEGQRRLVELRLVPAQRRRARPITLRTLLVVLFGVTATAAAAPQSTSKPADGNTTVRGRVLNEDGTMPLRRARIVIQTTGGSPSTVFSDDDGRFEAPAARSVDSLRVSKAGFAPQELRRSASTTPLEIHLVTAAVLAGRVTDRSGQPAFNVGVLARRLVPKDAPQPAEARLAVNDLGEFRLGNLVAGRYALYTERGVSLEGVLDNIRPGDAPAAIRQRREQGLEPTSEEVVVDVDAGQQVDVALVHNGPLPFRSPNANSIVTGTLVDEYGEPVEGARVGLRTLRIPPTATGGIGPVATSRSNDRGQFRIPVRAGRYLLVAAHGLETVEARQDDRSVLAVYYPGRFDVAEAMPVEVRPNQETPGLDMVVPSVRGAKVYGRATNSAGHWVGVLMASTHPANLGSIDVRFGSRVGDGEFEIHNVPPGSYLLQAAWAANGDPVGAAEFATLRVTVTSGDLGPLTLTTAPTSIMTGRVTLEGDASSVEPNDFTITALPVDRQMSPAFRVLAPDADIDSDWTFTVTGLASASRFRLARAPAGWWLKSVAIGTANAAEDPVSFGSKDDSRDDVTIVLSSHGATIAGRVVDDRRGDVDASNVVVFSTDSRRWFAGSRDVRTIAADSDGRFAVPSLAPGDYYVTALEADEADPRAEDLQDPDALNRLAQFAERISLSEGQQRVLELRLVRTPR
jgi:hypothetical protein